MASKKPIVRQIAWLSIVPQLLFMGLFAGFILGASGYTQARVAAYASEAFAETGQGFGNFMMIIGICETIALFTMVFTMLFAA